MYYNYEGKLQIHAPNGKTLSIATAPWAWFWSVWTFKIKPEFYAEGEGVSADGIYPTLLWLAEEDNGVYACFGACVCEHVAHARLRGIFLARTHDADTNAERRRSAKSLSTRMGVGYLLLFSLPLCDTVHRLSGFLGCGPILSMIGSVIGWAMVVYMAGIYYCRTDEKAVSHDSTLWASRRSICSKQESTPLLRGGDFSLY